MEIDLNGVKSIQVEIDEIYEAIIDKKLHSNKILTRLILEFEMNKHDFTSYSKSLSSTIEKFWGESLSYSYDLHTLLVSAVENFKDLTSDEVQNSAQYKVIENIYYRASQQHLEILTLLEHGFPDGANARWRSLHELYCIVEFISSSKIGEQLAQNFLSNELANGYDWARDDERITYKKKVKFWEIEKASIDFDEAKDAYNKACSVIHASQKGTFARMGNSSRDFSFIGFASPATNSATCIIGIVTNLLKFSSDSEKAINFIHASLLKIRECYFEAEKHAFAYLEEQEKQANIHPISSQDIDFEEIIERIKKSRAYYKK